MTITDTPGTSFEKCSLDIVGPFCLTPTGNKYILTCQCLLTKYCIGIPIPDATASTIAEAFVKRVICIYGTPKAILTDQGQNFLSNLMKQLAKILRIRQFKTTAFHPQSNGSLERWHYSLVEYIMLRGVRRNA